MRLNTAGVVAVVALVALAGCTGFAPGGTPGASPADDSPETAEPTETTDNNDQMTDDDEQMTDNDDQMTDDDDETTSDSGLVRFYISDEENAIGDFEHLNVTISEVGFQMAGNSDAGTDDGETDAGTDDGETDGDADETPENDTTAPPENTTDAPYNGTEVPEDNETEVPEDDENDEADDEDESGEWVEHEVDDRTFDLTQLQGANASLLEEFDVPEGSYNKVFVHVEEINGTLDNGESVNVKLPSEKLQITQSFTVEANDSVDFVFDITVHKAGNSGKYILTPVISESGTDVPIENVDEDESEDEQENESEDEQEESEDETNEAEMELNASFVGAVEPGENATVQVSSNGSAVANATVMVEQEVVGETDQTGELTFAVPEDVDELDITIESGDADLELKVEFEDPPPA